MEENLNTNEIQLLDQKAMGKVFTRALSSMTLKILLEMPNSLTTPIIPVATFLKSCGNINLNIELSDIVLISHERHGQSLHMYFEKLFHKPEVKETGKLPVDGRWTKEALFILYNYLQFPVFVPGERGLNWGCIFFFSKVLRLYICLYIVEEAMIFNHAKG